MRSWVARAGATSDEPYLAGTRAAVSDSMVSPLYGSFVVAGAARAGWIRSQIQPYKFSGSTPGAYMTSTSHRVNPRAR